MKLLLLVTVMITAMGGIAQSPDQRIIDYLGNTEASNLYTSNRAKYDHLLDYIENSWYTQDVSFKDVSHLTDIRDVEYIGTSPNLFDNGASFDLTQFNPLLYKIEIHNDQPSQYRLGETGQIIVFYSRQFYLEKTAE